MKKTSAIRLAVPVLCAFLAMVAVALLIPASEVDQSDGDSVASEVKDPECRCLHHLRHYATRLSTYDLPNDHSRALQTTLRNFDEALLCSFFLHEGEFSKAVDNLAVKMKMAESLITSRERLPDSEIHRETYEKHIVDMLHWLDVSLEHAESACNAKQGPGNVGGLLKPPTHHGFESPLG